MRDVPESCHTSNRKLCILHFVLLVKLLITGTCVCCTYILSVGGMLLMLVVCRTATPE